MRAILIMMGGLVLLAGQLERAAATRGGAANIEKPEENSENEANNPNRALTLLHIDDERRPTSARAKEAAGSSDQHQKQLENVMRLAMLMRATKTAADRKARLQISPGPRKQSGQQQQQQQQQVDLTLTGFEPQMRMGSPPVQRPETDLPNFEQVPVDGDKHYNQMSSNESEPRAYGVRESAQGQAELQADAHRAAPEDSHQQQHELKGDTSRGAHIRVVFNNNPRFIIGSSAGESQADAYSRSHLHRETRQPSSALYDDHYNLDESAPAETKVSALPCAKDRHELPATKTELPAVQEDQLNLLDNDDRPVSVTPVNGSKAPPIVRSKAPPIIDSMKQPEQRPVQQVVQQELKTTQVKQSIDSHSTKLEQMVRSGLRPPLRMVISMENNQGEFMKVPINLEGSFPNPGKSFEATPQVQVQVERSAASKTAIQKPTIVDEENTPQGGDIFEPNLATKLQTKQNRDPPKSIVQQVAQQAKGELEPTPIFKTTKEDCHHHQQQQQQEVVPPIVQATKVEQTPTRGVVSQQQVVEQTIPQVVAGQKTIQMTVPQLKEIHNKTFNEMMSKFQKALDDQMSKHFKNEPVDKVNRVNNQDQPIKTPDVQQYQAGVQKQQQHHQNDDQDDLVVALMAANMRHPPGESDAGGQMFQGPDRQQVSMTVIRPPKGTSIQEAVMKHAKEGQTMAIISSRLPSLESQAAMTRPAGANSVEPDQPVPPGGANDQPGPGPGVDPDGFSSSSSEALESSTGGSMDSPSESFAEMQFPFEWLQHQTQTRFRRDTKRSLDEGPVRKSIGKPAKRQSKSPSKSRLNDKNKAHQPMADQMLGAASQTESTSLDGSEEDDEADEDEANDGVGGGGGGSASDGSSSDEPAPSATGEVGQSTSGSAPDDGDYSGDMGDDFDDSTAFDADDEPYNTAAASDRDYSSAFKSFEIPSIDINPDTLKQKGCRTVLREVQEIPMNGLGAVQANGQPGSGYQTGNSVNQIEGVRVKRHATPGDQPNKNLINSRKVTSIVMTKECHFPNESREPLPVRRQQPIRVPAGRPTGQQVAFVVNQGGDSQPRSSIVQPTQPMTRPNPANQASFYHQSQQRVAPSKVVTNFYSDSKQQPIPLAAASQLVKYQLTAPVDGKQQQQQRQEQQDQIKASSSIRRRSVASAHPIGLGPKSNTGEQTALDSVARGVVAKKLYKPPSEDDPYHTLSYSSQNGADPDMDQDEDDSVVMGAEAESRRDSAQKKPSGTLSDRERAALMDPNHDDTDPVQRNARPPSDGSDAFDEADESDNDLSDESRPNQQRQRPIKGPPQGRPIKRPPAERNQIRGRSKDNDDDELDRADDQSGYRPPLRPPSPPQRAPMATERAAGERRRHSQQPFGRSFKFEHELSRPDGRRAGPPALRAVSGQLRQLSPGLRGYVNTNGRRESVEDGGHMANQLKELAATPTLSRRQDMDMDDDDDDDDDDGGGDNRGGGGRRSPAASVRNEDLKAAQEENPDADPEMNPREIHLPAHSKPKKFEKSFAYVHRDLPKKGAKNPDDFVVSYGRGNLQTEHEDYDSDRDHNSGPPPSASDEQDRAASSPRRTKVPDARLLIPNSRLAGRQFGLRHNSNATMIKS